MDVTCPLCFARFPLAAALTDAAARRALAQALRCTAAPVHLVLGYLDAYRPAKRSLSWRRAERLLGELADAMERGTVRRKGGDWPVTDAHWREGLEVVLSRRDAGQLQTPLRDHAYLWEVLSGLSSRTEASEERRVEDERRHRARTRTGNGEAQSAGQRASAYERLLDEARRLGVERDTRGMVRSTGALAEAVRAARAQEATT